MPRRVTQKEIKATRKEFLAFLAECNITEIHIEEAAWQYRINGVVIGCKMFAGEKEEDDWQLIELFAESFRNEIIDGFNDGFTGSQVLEVIPNSIKVLYQGELLEADTDINVEENSDS